MEHPSVYKTALDISPNNTIYINNDINTGKINTTHLENILS